MAIKTKPKEKEAIPLPTVKVDKDKYTKTKSASGKASLHNGDDVAVLMDGVDLDGAYKAAAKFLGQTRKELEAKYSHLNAGMQRMNLGNRIRGHLKKEGTKKDLKAAFK